MKIAKVALLSMALVSSVLFAADKAETKDAMWCDKYKTLKHCAKESKKWCKKHPGMCKHEHHEWCLKKCPSLAKKK
jgi:hypothetical protein